MYFVEKISNKIGVKISKNLNLSEDEVDIIVYGTIGVIQIIWCFLWVMLLGGIFKVLQESLIVCVTIALLRKYSGGVHASTPNRCAIIGGILSSSISVIIKNLNLPFNLVGVLFLVGLFVCSYYIIHKYSPSDTKVKPIEGQETINRLKKYSKLMLMALGIISFLFIIFYSKYKIYRLFIIVQCICFGALWQCFTITPIAKKSMNHINKYLNKND